MGFTHYWTVKKAFTDNAWERFTKDVKTILDNLPKDIKIVDGLRDLEGTDPIINDKLVSFNGLEDDAHESFYVEKNNTGFEFCKTARKPYDLAVVACLTSMKAILGVEVEVKSDGDFDDWQDGIALANDLLNLDMTFEEVVD